MEFRTKREAEEAAAWREQSAALWDRAAQVKRESVGRSQCEERAAKHRAEAARIRALLPTLPE